MVCSQAHAAKPEPRGGATRNAGDMECCLGNWVPHKMVRNSDIQKGLSDWGFTVLESMLRSLVSYSKACVCDRNVYRDKVVILVTIK